MRTPVVIILFNRPDTLERVMREVAKAKPPKLFLVADGPRPSHPEDSAKCLAARATAERLVNWECEVFRNYSEVNMGCGLRPSTGISWAFEQVEEAIILEDDCVPNPTFFRFCDDLLERYRDDERVMHINGSTYGRDLSDQQHSYSFTQLMGCWGWATWRRAWDHFDFSAKLWPHFRRMGVLESVFEHNEAGLRFFGKQLQDAYEHSYEPPRLRYWDYKWAFACWSNSGLGIVPHCNLISNAGCGNEATHTFSHPLGAIPTQPMPFALKHPPAVLNNWRQDREFFKQIILPSVAPEQSSSLSRLRRTSARIAPNFIKSLVRRLIGKTPAPLAEAESSTT